jgi:AcrR family transcriptional regulator
MESLPGRRRRADGEDRLRAILRATEALLRERPIAEISVADISARAGVVRSGFYFYFPTKGAAVAAVLGDVSDEMLSGAESFLADDTDGVEAIRAAMWAGWRAWSAHRDLVLGVLDARGTDPGVRCMWDDWAQRFVTTIGDELACKRERGAAAPGGDPYDLIVVLTSAVERTFERLSRADTESDQVAALIETLVSVWAMAIYGTYQPPSPPTSEGIPRA